jgi:hypothetical protein
MWQAGCQWLGRDAATGERLAQAAIDGIDNAQFEALTAEPRRYGWHATLKPPFQLREGTDLKDVDTAVQTLAGQFRTGLMPPLRVALMGNFLALRPQGEPVAANALAAACVEALQPLGRPLSAEEMQRRRRAPLTPQQDALLDEFRFHCSLTGPVDGLDAGSREALMQAAGRVFNHLPPEPLDSIAIFVEPTPGADFQLHRHWGLSA